MPRRVLTSDGPLCHKRGLACACPCPHVHDGAPEAKPSLYIVDALNFLFRAFHALPPLTTTKGLQTGAIYGLCQMILRIEREQRPTHLCVVYDAPGDNFRNEIFAEYKAHRPPMPPELAAQLGMVRRVVEAFGLAQLEVPGFEADDIIATLAKVARGAGHGGGDLLVGQGSDAALRTATSRCSTP